MRFQRNLSKTRPFPRGYFAPVTDRINTDQPLFQIGGNAELSTSESISLPEFLKVKARLNPIKRQGSEVLAVIEKQGMALRPYLLYQDPPDFGYQAIQVVFDSFLGLSSSFSHLLRESLEDPRNKSEDDKRWGGDKAILFEKSFLIQSQGSCVLKQAIVERKLIVTPPGRENGQPLWGYGGYYKMGCDLRQIEQMFFTPVGQVDQTGIHLTKASSWTAKGVMPSQKSDVVFMDDVADEGMQNLVGDIEQGKAILSLSLGVDDTGLELTQDYRSISIQQEDALTGFVEIVFRRYL